MAPRTRRLIVLGSTGSIGRQTLDVVAHLASLARANGQDPPIEVVGLAAGRRARELHEQAAAHGVPHTALCEGDDDAANFIGSDAAERLVREVDADVVMAAVVGAAGLPATLAAVELGRDVALANKETLVAAGALVVPAARHSGSKLLPVDSEHSALWQCLHAIAGPDAAPPMTPPAHVARLVLTASGGPFRTASASEVYNATPEQALAHPTWDMGPKVTIDCASLTNKALEVIEAHWLFGFESSRLGVLVHPQSIVHSLIETIDGSVLAQLGVSDMRLPIQLALTHPDRAPGSTPPLDLAQLARLDFEEPDKERFPALRLARWVIDTGGTAGAIFNAANEAAVHAFLAGRVPFGRIGELTQDACESVEVTPLQTVQDATDADTRARSHVERHIAAATRS
ncbi:MAG: 1-deoxy-D-xylulose-5-phosphate reductoisomerase [Phycisphaerales bacterium]|jgi:1-deoxy-D-xylulose-5-phosphate reductoisomerase